MYTYESYLKEQNSITFEEAKKIYNELLTEMNFKDDDCKDLWDSLMENIIKYVNIRSKCLIISQTERLESDKGRTDTHNSLISCFNALQRYIQINKGNNNWRNELGQERKRIGDFACYIAYVYSLNSR